MQMSEHGKTLLADWEGIRLKAYNDVCGLPTIGIRHLLTQTERHAGTITIAGTAVSYTSGLTQQQVMDLLGQDLVHFEAVVTGAVTVPLQQHQFDALVAFVFGVGEVAFANSTLLARLNGGDYAEVPNQLRRWVKAGGQTVSSLVKRRDKEIGLWEGH